MRSHRFPLFLPLWLLFVAGAAAQTGAPNDPASKLAGTNGELLKLNERLFREYLVHHNGKPFDETALEEFILVAANGRTETRSQILSTVSNLSVEQLTVENHHVISNADTVVLIGRLKVKGKILGRPLPGEISYLNVFVKGEKGWRLLARSLTPVAEARDAPR